MPALVEPGTLVVIVDDDAEVRESLADGLFAEGYAVQSVASAEAALAKLAGGVRPSLVILDLWLPGIGSRGFVRQLRSSSHVHVPVLVISGAAGLEHTELDVDAVLRKPSEMTTLVRAVDKLVGTARKPVVAPPPRARRLRRQRPRS